MKKFIFVVLLFLAFSSTAYATLGDCERATVLTAFASASSGDTVVCPAGTYTWSSAVTIPAGVTLRGQGIGSTIIESSTFVTHSVASNGQINGFEFSYGFVRPSPGAQNVVIQYCEFNMQKSGITMSNVDQLHTTAVYYKCTINDMGPSSVTGNAGQSDWYTNYPELGETNYVLYFDGCTWNNPSAPYTQGFDSNYGGSKVFRFNTINDKNMGAHGGRGTAARGTRRFEFYRNTVNMNPNQAYNYYMWWIRGGTGMFFDNTCTGNATQCEGLIDYERHGVTSWGKCDASEYTANVDTAPHPKGGTPNWLCRDGVGAGKDAGLNTKSGSTLVYGHGQTSSPIYIWNEKHGKNVNDTHFGGGCEDTVKEYRDVFIDESSNKTSIGFQGGGVIVGLYADLPECAASNKYYGYWATDMGDDWNKSDEYGGEDGALYVCDGEGTWDLYYTPAQYPHPLILPAGADEVLPTVVAISITTSGEALFITYSENIVSASGAAFTLTPSGGAVTVTCPEIATAAATMTCTLNRAIQQSETLTYSYTGTKVKDTSDNELAAITDQTVTNNSTQDTPPLVRLTVTKTGAGCTITSSPSGIICGSTCTADYDTGTVVTLGGYLENGWAKITYGTGCTDGTVTMSGAKSCEITCTEKKVLNWSR